MRSVLVVGAGLAGAVHARKIADAGHKVTVIDKRDHLAGNCFDYLTEQGVRVHRYGPHLFHTSNDRVVAWLSRFTEWTPYEHRVVARLPDGRLTPMPVNLDTVNAVFGTDLQNIEAVSAYLANKVTPVEPIVSAEDHLYSRIGPELTNLFFRPYTRKMWDLDLTEVDAAVVQRLQIRNDREDRYFPNDAFQAMPANGYTAMFESIFDHPNIDVRLRSAFEHGMLEGYDACFNSMPIDEFFEFKFGELPYRSIKFHLEEVPIERAADHATINFTDMGPYTRETWWHKINGSWIDKGDFVVKTTEEPCDYTANNLERYYPVKTSDGKYDAVYQRYKEAAAAVEKLSFIGRCGTYQYLDMHQVVNQSLVGADRWLDRCGT